jgi:hypothetical protein
MVGKTDRHDIVQDMRGKFGRDPSGKKRPQDHRFSRRDYLASEMGSLAGVLGLFGRGLLSIGSADHYMYGHSLLMEQMASAVLAIGAN